MPMVVSLPRMLGALRFRSSGSLYISIHGTSFSLLFSKFSKLLF